tara:strand:- start:135 stop:398 length:264 start_codon:yes stop_codon:yes gene_type:complete
MSEQQDHLKNLVSQRQTLLGEINDLNAQAAAKRELALRASGAIEYLQQIGIELPEPEEAPAEGEAAAAPEGETVVGDAPLPEPTVEG